MEKNIGEGRLEDPNRSIRQIIQTPKAQAIWAADRKREQALFAQQKWRPVFAAIRQEGLENLKQKFADQSLDQKVNPIDFGQTSFGNQMRELEATIASSEEPIKLAEFIAERDLKTQ